MTISAKQSLPVTLDNALKVLITILIGVVGYMQNQSDQRLRSVEQDVMSIKESIVELKTTLKYIGGKTAHNGQSQLYRDTLSAGAIGNPSNMDVVPN